MSILIKGMKMPSKCIRCPVVIYGRCLVNDDKDVSEAMENGVRDKDCPLIELLSHGRLIDADAAVANRDINMNWCYDLHDLPDYLKDCPTIIEAEEEES